MSADNALVVFQKDKQWAVADVSASIDWTWDYVTGSQISPSFDLQTEALLWAHDYEESNFYEYGVRTIHIEDDDGGEEETDDGG